MLSTRLPGFLGLLLDEEASQHMMESPLCTTKYILMFGDLNQLLGLCRNCSLPSVCPSQYMSSVQSVPLNSQIPNTFNHEYTCQPFSRSPPRLIGFVSYLELWTECSCPSPNLYGEVLMSNVLVLGRGLYEVIRVR